MFEQLNSFFKKIFNNEETIIFSVLILFALIMFTFFGPVLTPFLVSIVVAYLLVGVQKKIESFNVSKKISLIVTFLIFIIASLTLLIWLVPLLYIQLQAFVLDIPNLFNEFLTFVAALPTSYPDLISSEQKTAIELLINKQFISGFLLLFWWFRL